MTTQTKSPIRATYDANAFRIRVVSDDPRINTEISVTDVLFLAEKSGVPTGPLGPFVDGPLNDSLQNLLLNATNDFAKVTRPLLQEAITQALQKVEPTTWQGTPVYSGPAAQAYE